MNALLELKFHVNFYLTKHPLHNQPADDAFHLSGLSVPTYVFLPLSDGTTLINEISSLSFFPSVCLSLCFYFSLCFSFFLFLFLTLALSLNLSLSCLHVGSLGFDSRLEQTPNLSGRSGHFDYVSLFRTVKTQRFHSLKNTIQSQEQHNISLQMLSSLELGLDPFPTDGAPSSPE